MTHWTSQEWSAVLVAAIGAVFSGIASIVAALKAHGTQRAVQAQTVETQKARAAVEAVQARLNPPQGGLLPK